MSLDDKKTFVEYQEYNSYNAMKQRCTDKNHWNYTNYGAKGVSVCTQWLGKDGFKTFLKDMGEKPSKLHSIERIDVTGNYEPTNCKWATRQEQNNNRTTNKLLEFNGTVMTLAELARQKDINYKTAWWRYSLMGRNPNVY